MKTFKKGTRSPEEKERRKQWLRDHRSMWNHLPLIKRVNGGEEYPPNCYKRDQWGAVLDAMKRDGLYSPRSGNLDLIGALLKAAEQVKSEKP